MIHMCTYMVKVFVGHFYLIFKYCVDGLMKVVNDRHAELDAVVNDLFVNS